MKNIVLIGMPACGKSTIGSELTNALHFKFLDTDQVIKDKYQQTIPNLLKEVGVDEFKKIENDVYTNINEENLIISTGGSAIYSDNAMTHLKEIGTIIYLSLPYEDIESRIGDYKSRGLVMDESQTLLDIYNERTPLYNKYADITIYCEGKSISEITDEIISKLNNNNKEE